MQTLSPFAISGLLILITHIPLYILLILNWRNKVALVYSFHILTVLTWGLGSFLATTTINQELAHKYLIFAYSAVLFIPVFHQHTISLLIKEKSWTPLPLIYLQAIVFLTINLSGHLFDAPQLIFNSFYYYSPSPPFILSFAVWVLIVTLSHLQIINFSKKENFTEEKIFLFTISSVLGFLGGVGNFLPALSINFYPYGNFLVPLYTLVTTYAILRHKLLDIKVVIKKSIVYSLLVLLIFLFYMGLVLVSERYMQNIWGYQSLPLSIAAAFIIGILTFPLRNATQRVVDRLIFQKTQEEILKENELLLRQISQSEKMKSVATLASGMAHEIKNPLTPIRTFLEYLPQKSNDKEFLKKFGQLAQTSADRIDELINELLRFAKPTPLQLMDIDINKLITSTLDLLSSEFLKFHIRVVKNLEKPTLSLDVDQNQVRQALLNLFLNAIDAMPNGGALTIQTASTEKTCRISIQDTGQGIAKQDLLHIFDPFFTKKDKGTGLGLSITQRIITEHGGTIKVVSEPGQGATFIIELPINPTTS